MNLEVSRCAAPYRAPWQAIAAAAVLAVLGVVVAAQPALEEGPVVCPFRAATGLPCPTCGLLRTTHHVLHGHLGRAFATNPLDAVFLIVVFPITLIAWIANAARGFALRITLSSVEHRWAWTILAAIVAANWLYVVSTQR